jgi:hypothetical protein
MKLDDALKQLAMARESFNLARGAFDEFKALNPEFLEHHGKVNETRAIVNEAEELVKELALSIYEETGEKKVHEKVQIKHMTKYDYDPETALAWAREFAPALLILDKKGFESFVKSATQKPAFVTIVIEAKPYISSKL